MHLHCPMPKFDFEFITLGHGSGGLLTNKLLDSGVFDVLKNDTLNKRHDGAFLKLEGEIAFSTDSFVISPIFFPGGNIGELAVNGTVNDVAMCGAIPKYISLSFILEEGLPMSEFWEILVSIKEACDKAGVIVATGDTKVVDKGKGDKIFINTTGIGNSHLHCVYTRILIYVTRILSIALVSITKIPTPFVHRKCRLITKAYFKWGTPAITCRRK